MLIASPESNHIHPSATMESTSLPGMRSRCDTIITGLAALEWRLAELDNDSDYASELVDPFSDDLMGWIDLLGQLAVFLSRGGPLDSAATRTLDERLRSVDRLIERGNELVDSQQEADHLEKAEFLALEADFREEQHGLQLWIGTMTLTQW